VPAGTLAPGEEPAVCARRELEEEAGVRAGRLEPLTTIWTTPGFTTETIHLFWAAELTETRAAHERDEFIEVVPRPLSTVLDDIRRGGDPRREVDRGAPVSGGFVLAERNGSTGGVTFLI